MLQTVCFPVVVCGALKRLWVGYVPDPQWRWDVQHVKKSAPKTVLPYRSLISSKSCSAFCLCLASSENWMGSGSMEVRKFFAEGKFSTAT